MLNANAGTEILACIISRENPQNANRIDRKDLRFEVVNTTEGYVVAAYITDSSGYGEWRPLRNFGERQGDARDFMLYDCPKLTDFQISALIRNYRKDVRYIRISATRFNKQS